MGKIALQLMLAALLSWSWRGTLENTDDIAYKQTQESQEAKDQKQKALDAAR